MIGHVPHNSNHITGATTTEVSSRPGTLFGIAINTPIADASITIHDGDAAGPILAVITLPSDVTAMPPATIPYGLAYKTGLTIVTTGTGLDITALWR